MLRFTSSKFTLLRPTLIRNSNSKTTTSSSAAAFTQLSGRLNAASTSPSTSRVANPHTFEDESVQPSASGGENSTATPSTTTNETSSSTSSSKPLPQAVASMSDAEFDENVKVLKQIAQKSLRSLTVFIFGILTLWFARRKKAKQEEEERKQKEEDSDDEEKWKDLPAAEKYLKEMRSQGWPVDEGEERRKELLSKKEATTSASNSSEAEEKGEKKSE